jgi:hypothetical protein
MFGKSFIVVGGIRQLSLFDGKIENNKKPKASKTCRQQNCHSQQTLERRAKGFITS